MAKIKNIFLSIIFTSLASFSVAQKNVVKFDLFGLTQGVNRLSFERALGKHFSVGINAEYGVYSSNKVIVRGNGLKIYNIKGWGVMPEVRYYFLCKNNSAPLGFFAGVHGRARFVKENYYNNLITSNDLPEVKTNGKLFDYGIHLGYKYSWQKFNLKKNGINRFNIEVLAGYGLADSQWSEPNNRGGIPSYIIDKRNKQIWDNLRLQLSIGYLFGGVPKGPATFGS